jgi:hypothetical protein
VEGSNVTCNLGNISFISRFAYYCEYGIFCTNWNFQNQYDFKSIQEDYGYLCLTSLSTIIYIRYIVLVSFIAGRNQGVEYVLK